MEVHHLRDLVSCTSLALCSNGSLALLSGRRCFALLDLASPDSPVHREARTSKWDVVCSEWSAQEDHLVAVASNNKVELLTVTDREVVCTDVLRSHTRAITDLAWHTHDRQLLATSSADNYIYLWDRRDLRRPKAGLQAVQGAARVEWNKVSPGVCVGSYSTVYNWICFIRLRSVYQTFWPFWVCFLSNRSVLF